MSILPWDNRRAAISDHWAPALHSSPEDSWFPGSREAVHHRHFSFSLEFLLLPAEGEEAEGDEGRGGEHVKQVEADDSPIRSMGRMVTLNRRQKQPSQQKDILRVAFFPAADRNGIGWVRGA